MSGETKDHTTERKKEYPGSSSFDDVRNVIRPDGSCDYRDEKRHDDNIRDDTGLRERVKSASNTLSRRHQMFLKQASSRNLLIRPTKVSSIDHEWGHDFAIATSNLFVYIVGNHF